MTILIAILEVLLDMKGCIIFLFKTMLFRDHNDRALPFYLFVWSAPPKKIPAIRRPPMIPMLIYFNHRVIHV
jgi:hypothetical protein